MKRRTYPIRSGPRLRALALALVALPCAAGWAAPTEKSTCEICHSDVAVEYRDSAHLQAEITCVTCHGGNPNDPSASAMAAAAGFRGRPSRQEIPQLCGSCHSDRAQMAQYGLPTHQLEDYRQSVHGKAWQQGDTKVAVCVDCHGQHRILPEKDPRSSVSRKSIAGTCARCHGDAALMSQYGLPATAYKEYMASVHARTLEGAAPEASPTCSTCHASHAALPPNAKDIPNVCSRCHRQVKDLVEAGPHREPLASGVMSCASCHGYHGIAAADDGQLLSACGTCHYRFSAPAQAGDSLYARLAGSAERYKWAMQAADWLESRGVFLRELRGRLEEANMGLLEGRRDQHELKSELVEKDLVVTDAVVDAVEAELRHFAASATARKLGLVLFWCYTGLMILLLYWKRRQSEDESD